MAEQRDFETVICVKNGASPTCKIELFPAEQWKDGPQGKYRLRINRKWYEPDGHRCYLAAEEIAMVVMKSAGMELKNKIQVSSNTAKAPRCDDAIIPIRPNMPVGTHVRAPGKVLAGETILERTQTLVEPLLGYDKRWYVAVRLFDKGKIWIPVDDLVWSGSPMP